TKTRIVLTGGLDEYAMDELSLGPVDGFGAGEKLIHHPSPGFVYKLVAIAESDEASAPMRAVAKTAIGKTNIGGQKWAYREYAAQGLATAEHSSSATLRHTPRRQASPFRHRSSQLAKPSRRSRSKKPALIMPGPRPGSRRTSSASRR